VAADLVDGARLLGEVGGEATYLGYSMGARFCLHLALARPDLVKALVLISGTAGIDDVDERTARRASDEALAAELDPSGATDPFGTTDPPGATGSPEPDPDPAARLEAFLRRWLDSPLFADVPEEANGLIERGRNTGTGLASSLRLAGTGTQQPLWSQLHRLAMPVLVITGELDDKFTRLGSRMVDGIGPQATQVVIPDAGHAPHLHHPAPVAAAMRDHLI
jgi:pimeloyl-ACP methyl ester carboxylesterase